MSQARASRATAKYPESGQWVWELYWEGNGNFLICLKQWGTGHPDSGYAYSTEAERQVPILESRTS